MQLYDIIIYSNEQNQVDRLISYYWKKSYILIVLASAVAVPLWLRVDIIDSNYSKDLFYWLNRFYWFW